MGPFVTLISARPVKASAQILQENFFDEAEVAADGGERGTTRPKVCWLQGRG